MTAEGSRYTVKDWGLGLLVFVIVGVLGVLVLSTVLRAAAPYGWNRTVLRVIAIASLVMSFREFWRRRRGQGAGLRPHGPGPGQERA